MAHWSAVEYRAGDPHLVHPEWKLRLGIAESEE